MENVLKVRNKTTKRLGRGYGSGKGGHTSSRGTKGQKARTKVHILFEGLKVRKSLLNRLPFQRGKSKFKPNSKPVVFNLSDLNIFADGETVTEKALFEKGLIKSSQNSKGNVKVLGQGTLEKKLTVELLVSSTAREKIESLGGKVV